MKVLLINKYYYIKGGSETYFFGIKDILEKNGHEVVVFSMKDDKNFESKYEKNFVENINYNNKSLISKIKNGLKLINSHEAYIKLCKLIEETKPDIAHVNLIYHQLTPAIFHALKKYNIPIVFTAHDYKIICPNYKIYNRNRICKKCYGGKYYNCFLNNCHKKSFSYSFLLMLEAYYHKFKGSYELINKIICPSKFMKEQILLSGIPSNKLIHIPNFISNEFYIIKFDKESFKRENIILYYGRLSKEKGIETLLDAKKRIDNVKLKIIGIGPEEEYLKNKVKDEKINNVIFLGFKSGNDLLREISSSKCTIIPSVWNEVFGLTIIESFSVGTPVIGAKAGGITEIIKENLTGFLYNPYDITELVDRINKVVNMEDKAYLNMAENCYKEKLVYSSETYYLELIRVYDATIKEYQQDAGFI